MYDMRERLNYEDVEQNCFVLSNILSQSFIL